MTARDTTSVKRQSKFVDHGKGMVFMKTRVSLKGIGKFIWVFFALASMLFWIPKVDKMITSGMSERAACIALDDAWDVTIKGEVYPNVLLTDFPFPPVEKGDEIIMERTLPSDWELIEGALRFYVRHCAVKMYIDSEPVYTYGYDRLTQGKTLGSGYQFIKFPDSYKGKTFRIHLYSAEDHAFAKFDAIKLYEWEHAYPALMVENRLPLFCGCFLLLFGLIANVITIFALVGSIKYIRLFCISIFSICMGLWTLSYYNVMAIFGMPLYSISLINYLALYLAPIPLTVYMHHEIMNLGWKPLEVFYRLFFVTETTAIFAMITLHGFDIAHMAGTLKYMQVIFAAGLLFFFVVLLLNVKFSKVANRLSVFGMLIVMLCIAYDMVGYNFMRYLGNDFFNVRGVSSSGIMIFICILFLSFYIEMTQSMMQQKERDFLIKRAYTDELTQLHNRRYCMEYMNKLKEERDFKYTVLCFDVNNLKTVNDTCGHAKGDLLIRSAAEVIAKTFEPHGFVARVGGDEFVAVIRTADETEISLLVEQFLQDIADKNRTVTDMNLSIAYGYACGSQSEHDIEKVYQVADDRMYEKKRKMKGSAR